MKRWIALAFGALAFACAQPQPRAPAPPPEDSLLPGTIGAWVVPTQSGIVISALGKDSPAERSGLRPGDVVTRLNGEPVTATRDFYRRLADSRPGSVVRIEVLRDGAARRVDVPVRQLDTMPRV